MVWTFKECLWLYTHVFSAQLLVPFFKLCCCCCCCCCRRSISLLLFSNRASYSHHNHHHRCVAYCFRCWMYFWREIWDKRERHTHKKKSNNDEKSGAHKVFDFDYTDTEMPLRICVSFSVKIQLQFWQIHCVTWCVWKMGHTHTTTITHLKSFKFLNSD